MYISSICCNIGHYHWFEPAKWFYYNLIDGDLASNHLSWQWVAGSFSKKKYFANQDNINKYFKSTQKNTFLDVDYSEFDSIKTPELLKEYQSLELKTKLPSSQNPELEDKKTLVFNYYNLDPMWRSEDDYQKLLLLEPSFFEKFPVSENVMTFFLKLAENIKDLKIFVGEFSELNAIISKENIFYKEHPTNKNYVGNEDPRKTLTDLHGDFPSFFNFWKKAKKILQKEFETKS